MVKTFIMEVMCHVTLSSAPKGLPQLLKRALTEGVRGSLATHGRSVLLNLKQLHTLEYLKVGGRHIVSQATPIC